MERTASQTQNSAAPTAASRTHPIDKTSGRTPLDRPDALCRKNILETGEGRRTASASGGRGRWRGRLNKSSERLTHTRSPQRARAKAQSAPSKETECRLGRFRSVSPQNSKHKGGEEKMTRTIDLYAIFLNGEG